MNYNELKQLIREEVSKIVNETKASYIDVGDEYTLSTDSGKLKKGDKVKVTSVKSFGNDISITLTNGKVSDTFTLDRNDTFDALT